MFHKNLKTQRLKSGLSQKQVADFLCVSSQSISKWEKGSALPSVLFLPKLAECLNCDINDFFAAEEKITNFEILNSYFALMASVHDTDGRTNDQLYAFMSKNAVVTECVVNFCKDLLQYKTVNIRIIQNLLNCNEAEGKSFVGYLQRCEILEELGIHDSYFVMKDATEGFIYLIKMQEKTCEIMSKLDK